VEDKNNKNSIEINKIKNTSNCFGLEKENVLKDAGNSKM
jgi:hypothetical protein